MKSVSQETVAAVRARYPKGTRVELVKMDDPYGRLEPGDRGTVRCVDDSATVHVAWDRGFGLGPSTGWMKSESFKKTMRADGRTIRKRSIWGAFFIGVSIRIIGRIMWKI